MKITVDTNYTPFWRTMRQEWNGERYAWDQYSVVPGREPLRTASPQYVRHALETKGVAVVNIMAFKFDVLWAHRTICSFHLRSNRSNLEISSTPDLHISLVLTASLIFGTISSTIISKAPLFCSVLSVEEQVPETHQPAELRILSRGQFPSPSENPIQIWIRSTHPELDWIRTTKSNEDCIISGRNLDTMLYKLCCPRTNQICVWDIILIIQLSIASLQQHPLGTWESNFKSRKEKFLLFF